MQIAGVISAVIVLIVILAIGFLLEPLQKVLVNFTLHFLHLPKTGLLQESLKVFIGFGGSQTGFCKAWFFFQDHDREDHYIWSLKGNASAQTQNITAPVFRCQKQVGFAASGQAPALNHG